MDLGPPQAAVRPAWMDAFQRAHHPVALVEGLLGATPDLWQREALEALYRHDRVAIRSGHGVGKTALLAWAIIWWMLTHFPCKIPATANSEKQLRDVTWAELALWLRRLPDEIRSQFEINTERCFLKAAPEECFAVSRTASKDRPEALQGFHAENLLFVIEEASGIPEPVFEVAQGALSTPGAKVLMAGNPTRLSGFFYDAFHRMRDRWVCIRVSSEDVERARGHIEDIRERYGEDSNAYRVRVLGEFPSTEDEQVIPLDWIESAIEREIDSSMYQPIWGLDVARFGDDETALIKRVGRRLPEPSKTWKHKNTTQVVGLVQNEYEEAEDRPQEIMVDSIGVGAGVLDLMLDQGLPARGINVGEVASARDRFFRLRDELWWKGRQWFEGKDVSISDDPRLIHELSTPYYAYNAAGKVVVESKSDLKSRGVKSPNVADAFLLTLAGKSDVKDEIFFEGKKWRKKRRPNSWMSY